MNFQYRARDDKGRQQEGVIQASSEEAALRALDRHGLYVTFLSEVKDKPLYARRITLLDRVSSKDVMLFSRQLAIMFKAQVPLVDALSTIGRQMKSRAFREKILDIAQEVEAGTAFSDALARHPKVFSLFFVNMVKRGEALGKLSDVLNYLAQHLEEEHRLKSKIRGAMMYPLFVIVIAVGVMTMLAVVVLPNLTKVLEESDQELPVITQVVIASSNFYREWWWVILSAVAVVGLAIFRYSKTKSGRKVTHTVALKLPVFGTFLHMMYVSRFGENLSTLISGGVPIVQALSITGKIIGNEVYERIVQEAKDSVSQGSRVADVFRRYPKEFPIIFTQMIQVGEKSGALDATLSEVVKFYQQEMEQAVETFLSLIEPILIVVLGVLVGGLMASLMLPLYQGISGGG